MAGKSDEWQSVYVDIMQEIRLRERVIDDLLFGEVNLGRAPRFEFAHLELRMICELIAISSLVAHRDIPATKSKRMRTTWEADKILRVMSQLRSDFFPVAVSATRDEAGQVTIIDNPKGSLLQSDIISLYHECGKVLHRGNLENFGQTETSKENFVRIGRLAKKITILVSAHEIAGYGPDGLFLWLITVDDNLVPGILRLKRLGDLPAEDQQPPAQQDTAPPETESPPDGEQA